jgi:hypothetical protein
LLDIVVAPAILNTCTSCILRAPLHAFVVLDVALDEIVLVCKPIDVNTRVSQ